MPREPRGGVLSRVQPAPTAGITGRVGSLITGGVLFLFGFQLIMIGLLADMIRSHSQY